MKTDEEYKKWKEAEDKKIDDKLIKYKNDSWWNSLDTKIKKEFIKTYGSKED